MGQRDRVRFLREKIFKRSQKEMAQLLELPERTYQRLEQEERDIKSSILLKYAKLGVNPTWLLTGEGPMFVHEAGAEGEGLPPELARAVKNPRIQKILQLIEMIPEEDRGRILDQIHALLEERQRQAEERRRLMEKIEALERLIKKTGTEG